MTGRPPQETLDYLRKAVDLSKRRGSVRLPVAFARDRITEARNPPLAQMLQGGGRQLQTYLTILMRATKAPHEARLSTASLARMLHAGEVTESVRKRIAREIKKLEDPELPMLQVMREHGRVPNIQVLNPDGTGVPWNVNELQKPYITLPIELWTKGWILALRPRALGMLIIMRELTNGRKNQPDTAWVDPIRKQQYGLSPDTWTRATADLERIGLLTVERVMDEFQGEPRRRNLYTLEMNRLRGSEPWG